MTSFDLLSYPIKKFIRDQRWPSLRPIQKAAIQKILQTENNYILSARTASGKTEAAFFPILSKVDFSEPGVQVLYISPLVALINDQFKRVMGLCRYLEVSVTKWHGEANRTAKNKLLKEPNGIVLITPESIEAMFVNRPYQVAALFQNLKFIVIDEIHSFLGNERGVQLKSLLYRIQEKSENRIRFVALSATIAREDYDVIKSFFGKESVTKVLLDNKPQEIEAKVAFYETGGKELPLDLLKQLYLETQSSKALIFPNSRARVEEVAVKLKKIAEKVGGHQYYYAHHSSVNRELREDIEKFVKENKRFNYGIACTSTLELGIDIGSVDFVSQIDATFSVASLSQRLGRSGRQEGTESKLLMCATNKWTLLQSLACYELLRDGFLESVGEMEFPIDILFHQILSILLETSGVNKNKLVEKIKLNYAFDAISIEAVWNLIEYMKAMDYVEEINEELIIGFGAENLISGRKFYTVFRSPVLLKVLFKNKIIGEVPPSPQIAPDQNIYLAAKVWKILEVDTVNRKIYVGKTNEGKKPIFFGGAGNIDQRIRHKMLQIIFKGCQHLEVTGDAATALLDLHNTFKALSISIFERQKPVFITENEIQFYSFTSTKINNTLIFLFKGLLDSSEFRFDGLSTSFLFKISYTEVLGLFEKAYIRAQEFDTHLKQNLEHNEKDFQYSKWGDYLPLELKKDLLLNSYFAVEETVSYLSSIELVKF